MLLMLELCKGIVGVSVVNVRAAPRYRLVLVLESCQGIGWC